MWPYWWIWFVAYMVIRGIYLRITALLSVRQRITYFTILVQVNFKKKKKGGGGQKCNYQKHELTKPVNPSVRGYKCFPSTLV